MSVLFFTWFPISKNYTSCNRVRSLNIRIIKTFYMTWFYMQTQIFFHLRHNPFYMPLWIYNLCLFKLLLPVIFCISFRKFYNAFFISQFRNRYFYYSTQIHIKRNINFRRNRVKTLSYFNNKMR